MIDRYEMLTGDRISKQLLEYHSAGFCGVNGFLMWGLAYDTTLDQDYIAYMHYSVATTRWAIKAIAEHMGLTLTEPEEPMFRPLDFSRAGKHLVEQIRAMPDGKPVEDYARDSAAALARYMSRCNDYGQNIHARDLAEASALVGHLRDNKDGAQADRRGNARGRRVYARLTTVV